MINNNLKLEFNKPKTLVGVLSLFFGIISIAYSKKKKIKIGLISILSLSSANLRKIDLKWSKIT